MGKSKIRTVVTWLFKVVTISLKLVVRDVAVDCEAVAELDVVGEEEEEDDDAADEEEMLLELDEVKLLEELVLVIREVVVVEELEMEDDVEETDVVLKLN